MKSYGVLVLGALTLTAVAIHPTPWCIDCETPAPFGRVYTRLDDVLQLWLLFFPFLIGLLRLEKRWVVPMLVVAAQIMAQFIAGEPWASFVGNEGPFIVLVATPVSVLSLLIGLGCRYGLDKAADIRAGKTSSLGK